MQSETARSHNRLTKNANRTSNAVLTPMSARYTSASLPLTSSAALVGAVVPSSSVAHGDLIALVALSITLGVLVTGLLSYLCLRCHYRKTGINPRRAHVAAAIPAAPIPNDSTITPKISITLPRPDVENQVGSQPNDPLPIESALVQGSPFRRVPAPVPLFVGYSLASETHNRPEPSGISPASHVDEVENVVWAAQTTSEGATYECRCRCIQVQPSIESSSASSIPVFTQGRDEVFHPEVRALLEENTLTKEAVGKMVPMKPRADTVNPGYNPKLDEQRPTEMVDYLRDYRILFVIDDSASMFGDLWREARDALSEIAEHALRYHSDAIDIRFFNNQYMHNHVKGTHEVMQIFDYVSPNGETPTGHVLEEVLNEQIDRLDIVQRTGGYASEPPLDIIVLTDGVPNHNSPPAPVIEVAAKRLKDNLHHPNVIGIQFVQIGNDPAAEPTLLSLIHGPNNDMVDTVSYRLYAGQTPDGKLTSDVLERIILGGLHPNLRAYWNQHQQRF